MSEEVALVAESLRIEFPRRASVLRAADNVSFTLKRGRALGLVGESGSGKTMIALSLLGLVPAPGRVSGSIRLAGYQIVGASERDLRSRRGRDIGIVFQDPMTGLNPVRRIGSVLVESQRLHQRIDVATAKLRALQMLKEVGVPAAEERLQAYPHELSGGLRQRAMIALALINRPGVIVADEPTTALDATIQAQILDLLRARMKNASLLLITHDLAVAGDICDDIAVIYHGRIVEHGPADRVLRQPQHPYTIGLLNAAPRFDRNRPPLTPIPGGPPGPDEVIAGCAFAPRCPKAIAVCAAPPMLQQVEGRAVACWRPAGGSIAA